MSMKIIGLLAYLLCFISCQNLDSTKQKTNYPICLDRIDVIPSVLVFDESKEEYKYNLLYIGVEKDTILIDYNLGLSLVMGPPLPPPPSLDDPEIEFVEDSTLDVMMDALDEWSERRDAFAPYWCGIEERMGNYEHVIWDSANVTILVDTNRYILSYNWAPIPNESFKAYPVIIKNIEKDTIMIATRDYIGLVLEEETKDGWETLIEPFRHRGCGMGVTYLLLPPKEVLVTSLPVYKFKKATQLRLKLGNNYSSIFQGSTGAD